MREVRLSYTVECLSWRPGERREERVTGCNKAQAVMRKTWFEAYHGRFAVVTITEEEYKA